MESTCMVFFESANFTLEGAIQSLTGCGLEVSRDGELIRVGRTDGPWFEVGLARGDVVRAEASEIGAGTPHAGAMSRCDARFEIHIADLGEALDEINTLMEVQGALQDASKGFLFLPWNGALTEPWQD